ncbi:unnamed protein product [Lampetra planeri]
MDTRRTARTREPGAEETTTDFGPEMAEGDSEQPGPNPPTPQRQDGWGPSADGLRLAHTRLAELLYAGAATLEEITRLGAGGAARDDDSRHAAPVPAISTGPEFEFSAMGTVNAEGGAGLRHVTDVRQTEAATSSGAASASPTERPPMPHSLPAKTVWSDGNDRERSSTADAALQQRLPPLKEFVGEDVDWGGFQRRFIAHQEMAQWTDDEALRALPAMLDSDALATLPRRRERTLLALAKTAFPRMDEEGVDAMVTEKILLLADELDIVVLAQDDTEMCSLRAVRHIHANLLSQRRKASKAAASHTVAATTLPSEEICAVDRPTEWRSGVRPAWDGPSRQDQPKSSGALTRCYNCGLRGHSAAAIAEAFVQGYVLDKGAPERLLTDQGPTKASQWRGPKSPEPMLL